MHSERRTSMRQEKKKTMKWIGEKRDRHENETNRIRKTEKTENKTKYTKERKRPRIGKKVQTRKEEEEWAK